MIFVKGFESVFTILKIGWICFMKVLFFKEILSTINVRINLLVHFQYLMDSFGFTLIVKFHENQTFSLKLEDIRQPHTKITFEGLFTFAPKSRSSRLILADKESVFALSSLSLVHSHSKTRYSI